MDCFSQFVCKLRDHLFSLRKWREQKEWEQAKSLYRKHPQRWTRWGFKKHFKSAQQHHCMFKQGFLLLWSLMFTKLITLFFFFFSLKSVSPLHRISAGPGFSRCCKMPFPCQFCNLLLSRGAFVVRLQQEFLTKDPCADRGGVLPFQQGRKKWGIIETIKLVPVDNTDFFF